MEYLEEEVASRRVIALGLATFYTMKCYEHVNLSCYKYGADVTLFIDTRDEAEKALEEAKNYVVEDCSTEIVEWNNESGHYYSLEIKY